MRFSWAMISSSVGLTLSGGSPPVMAWALMEIVEPTDFCGDSAAKGTSGLNMRFMINELSGSIAYNARWLYKVDVGILLELQMLFLFGIWVL